MNIAVLPVMLSSKLLPEMEVEETTKREQLLSGITNLPVPTQIEKLKVRIDMIGSACETAEKVIAECRKSYGLGSRQGTNLGPTLDKAQAAKIQEQEGLLRAAVNYGEGLRVPGDQRHPQSLPIHLIEVLPLGDGAQNFGDSSGSYPKNMSTFAPNSVNSQGNQIQASGGQLLGRPAPSPGTTGTPNFENVSTPPMPYANSPRSGTNMMNTPSPQQHLTPQQQRQKLMQHSQPLHQPVRPSAAGMLAQVPGQQQMQYNQALSQQFHNRQMQPGRMQPGMAQSQLNQGTQLRSHLGQFTGAANNAMFNAAQASSNSQMMANMHGSQSLMPQMQSVFPFALVDRQERHDFLITEGAVYNIKIAEFVAFVFALSCFRTVSFFAHNFLYLMCCFIIISQYGMAGGHPHRSHPQMLTDQMFGMGATNSSMMGMQQQQQGLYGNMQAGAQNVPQGMAGLQNQTQNPNFTQQRQQNQQ
ncbi:Mediator of RNA polymerase II transcription subunit 8 [Zea mays]|uniref:Mediator of RNA polymerase II transcription subunit 8 n=1 Tax=Zea mays TaxID=4577 RepID=A0A1D6IAK5_MAIZE|nr:Mediator of RNA polymerase II transcription subunit 8 [Zea mays]